jgi:hypothetical protein
MSSIFLTFVEIINLQILFVPLTDLLCTTYTNFFSYVSNKYKPIYDLVCTRSVPSISFQSSMGPKRVIGPEERERRRISCREYRKLKKADPEWRAREVERTRVIYVKLLSNKVFI